MSDDRLPSFLAVDHADEIAERIDELIDEGGDPLDVPWRIESDDLAEWCMRMLGEAEERLGVVRDQSRAWIEKIVSWSQHAAGPAERTARFFRMHLQDYALRERRERGRKTVELPSGIVGTRGPTPGNEYRAVIADEDAVIGWAHELDLAHVLKLTETIRLTEWRGEVSCKVEADPDGNVISSKVIGPDGRPVPGAYVEIVTETATGVRVR